MTRRERWGVIGAILTAIETEAPKGGDLRLTGIATLANVAYDRLQGYLAELTELGLVEGRPPRLTASGQQFLEEYRRWMTTLARYGFETGVDQERSGGSNRR